ncbi:hypothetical protein FPHOBKDP_00029 [Listeria phage LPJP1]|nr:hypothetical protein FPHOBKDP_00029 [Listeria phage LPJP1]
MILLLSIMIIIFIVSIVYRSIVHKKIMLSYSIIDKLTEYDNKMNTNIITSPNIREYSIQIYNSLSKIGKNRYTFMVNYTAIDIEVKKYDITLMNVHKIDMEGTMDI